MSIIDIHLFDFIEGSVFYEFCQSFIGLFKKGLIRFSKADAILFFSKIILKNSVVFNILTEKNVSCKDLIQNNGVTSSGFQIKEQIQIGVKSNEFSIFQVLIDIGVF